MGDRGNIAVLQRGYGADRKPGQFEQVWFYSHWSGSELPQVLRDALARRQRWNDDSYLARIIFCEMVKGDEAEEAGFGISTQLGDNEHPILVVDIPKQRVFEMEESQLVDGRVPQDYEPKESLPFEEYVSKALTPTNP